MSAHRLIEIRCDGPNEQQDCPGSRAWVDSDYADGLRMRMRDDGWTKRGRIDRCADCSAKAAAPSRSVPLSGPDTHDAGGEVGA